MWIPLAQNDDTYLFKFDVAEDNQVSLYISDFKNIWAEVLDQNNFLMKFQDLNPMIESAFVTIITELLNLIRNNECKVIRNQDEVNLEICGKLLEFRINYTFNCKKSSADLFLKEITIPMIDTIVYFEMEHRKLCQLLEKKDQEIKQHEFENGQLERKAVITEKFEKSCPDSAQKKALLLDTFVKSQDFACSLKKKFGLRSNVHGLNSGTPVKMIAKTYKPKKKIEHKLVYNTNK